MPNYFDLALLETKYRIRPMNRRTFIQLNALAVSAPAFAWGGKAIESPAVHIKAFEFEEAGIPQLRAALDSGRESAFSLAKKYLRRTEDLNRRGPNLNAVIELNPDALAIARDLDRQRKQGAKTGPLHGIPVLIKDNIDTHDRMTTTAGSLALLGSIAPRDSTVAQKLRAAGAVILGKTNLSEWANFRGDRSSSGWSGRGGQTNNPYALDRNPSGSSSGSAVAVSANLCAVAVGTETDGSIISPSSVCGIVGIKPTLGLISRAGIIPIAHSQDTAGPMARTVRDAAILLGVLAGADERDIATQASTGHIHTDYTRFLDPAGLRGSRIGVARALFRGVPAVARAAVEAGLDAIKSSGGTLVDFTEDLGRFGSAEHEVLLYEFKDGLNRYLASLGASTPVRTLQDVIEFNERHKDQELQFFGQETMVRAQEKGPLTEQAYIDALEKCRRMARDEGIDAVIAKYRLDAIVAPSGGPAGKTDHLYGDRGVGGSSSPAAVAGYPSITVPAGTVLGMPFGLSFFGTAWSEPALLKIAYAFEQATAARRVPKLLPTLP